ncbi:DUF1566 domain-containing protein [Kiritimatiellota bacterium B12222]|nr:DUF1566 domain-containing protein [Kiritimatiellota bacterium B12222]
MKNIFSSLTRMIFMLITSSTLADDQLSYPLVDTGQIRTYTNKSEISYPQNGEAFYGQDAQYQGLSFSFKDQGDGTVSDLNTGLMWQQVPSPEGFSWEEAIAYCNQLKLGGYDDWRIPTLKELFSISDFSTGWPYVDTTFFSLATGHMGKDEQFWCAEDYKVGTTHGGVHSAFGVNHVTGHIKAYPSGKGPMGGKHVRAVRGEVYGVNAFVDNGDGTITDEATGLTWAQMDSEIPMEWKEALAYAESAVLAGHDDWRLPNIKELQSIVSYTGDLPAIDPVFRSTPITNEMGLTDYGYYWSSTSAQFSSRNPGYFYAWYVAFGRAVNSQGEDTHGAGAVRFDTKIKDGPNGEGGERYANYVRLVRGGDAVARTSGPLIEFVRPVEHNPETLVPQMNPGERPQAGISDRPGFKDLSGAAFIVRLDQDGDGKVSKAEFDGPEVHFTQSDQNKDGFLSEDEAPAGPPQSGHPPSAPPPGPQN